MNRWIIIILCISSLTSCNNKNRVPKGILGQVKMQEVLWDMLNAQAYTSSFIKNDSLGNIRKENLILQKEILNLHQISKEDFYRSYDYYRSNPELMETVLDSISAKAQRDRNLRYNQNFKPPGSK